MRVFTLLSLAALAAARAFAAPPAWEPRQWSELEEELRLVMRETGAPGAAAAVVGPEGVLWARGFGVAERASGRPVTPDTPFRLGSISKSFVALAVLLLVEEGRLSLDDPLRALAPEVAFDNPWRGGEPVRLVHLLEHTAGFDDIHLREYAHSDPAPVTLAQGLAFHPRSRRVRWRPGTHQSYCNSGPAIAAFVVEKVSGRTFEEFVAERLLAPLGMDAASFLLTPQMEARLVTGYGGDGVTPLPYWHILMRPSGSLNASAVELAALVRLLLARGALDGERLLSAAAIERMETPRSSSAARAGVTTGYALGNYSLAFEERLFQGHGGGVNNGIAEYGYLPRHHVGYVLLLNSSQGESFRRMREILRGFVAAPLPPVAAEPEVPLPPAEARRLAGWYEPVAVRQETTRFLVRWTRIRVRAAEGGLVLAGLFDEPRRLTHVGGLRFRVDERPRASHVFLEGGLLQGAMPPFWGSYRRLPTVRFWAESAAAVLVLALMASSPLAALAWVPRKLFGRLEGEPLAARVVTLAAVLTLGAAFLLVAVSVDEFVGRFGRPTVWSLGLWALPWLFAALSVWGVAVAWRGRRGPGSRWARTHSMLVAAANLAATLYLAAWGILGYRSWV